MKCPKCGKEYVSESCPNCKNPQVIVNDNDYLRRKKEWEESGTVSGIKVKQDIMKKEKTSLKEEQKDADRKDIITAVNDRLNKMLQKKYLLKVLVCLVLIVIAVSAGNGIYKLIRRQNKTLYIVTAGRIYTNDFENQFVCNEKDAIYTAVNNRFFAEELPSEIVGKNVLNSLASENGKYFVTVTYDNKGIYALYLWNEQEVKEISTNQYEKEIKYVSDKGKVMFTDIEYLYEGAVSSIALYIYDESETKNSGLYLVDANIRSQYLYLNNNALIYLTRDNDLYMMNFEKMSDPVMIEEEIRDIYGISEQADSLYGNATPAVKREDAKAQMVYNKNGKYYYYDIDAKKSKYLFDYNLAGAEIIYEERTDTAYCIGMTIISKADTKEDEEAALDILDNINNVSDCLYLEEEAALVYISKDNKLISCENGKSTVIREQVTSGSLNPVKEISSGITYVSDGVRYYRKNIRADEIKLQNTGENTDIGNTAFYKGKIYFINDKGELCSCNQSGSQFSVIGRADTFWVY